MFRFAIVFLYLLASLATSSASSRALQAPNETCHIGSEVPISCRIFTPENGEFSDKVDSLVVVIYHLEDESSARKTFASSPAPDGVTSQTFAGVEIGDEYLYFPPSLSPELGVEYAELRIRTGNLVSFWIVKGNDADMAFALLFVHGLMTNENGASPDGHHLLPTVEMLPEGFTVQDEFLYTPEVQAEEEPTKQPITRTPRVPAEPTAVPTETVTRSSRSSGSSSTSSSSTGRSVVSGPIEILDISGRDAGIGDGTVYIYVEVQNVSNRNLSYVQVDVACRDSNGTVIGTGIANQLGLAPGDTAILTGIVMSVPDCDTIHAKVNPLTD